MQQADALVGALHRWTDVFMQRSMRDFMGYARESGLSMSQWGALFRLHHRGSCAVSDLGDHLGVTISAASQLLERLVQQNLILRSEDPGDRRVKLVVLTDKGRRVLEEGVHARLGWLSGLAETLSDSEREAVVAALQILTERAERLSPPVEPNASLL
jgi:DNA-binding MarR family transcriptional regulator